MLTDEEKEHLKNELYLARISNKQIAERAGMSKSGVSHYISGVIISSPRIEYTALKLLKEHYDRIRRLKDYPVKVTSYFFPNLTKK